MRSFKFPIIRLAGALVATGAVAGLLALGAGGAAAATLSYALVPASGATGSGGGTVIVSTTAGTELVQIDLGGARAGNSYNLSLCTNTGVAYSCGAAGTVTTDATGSFHGTTSVTSASQIDLVTLVNTADQSDAYQAITGTTPLYTGTSIYPSLYGATVAYNAGYAFPFGIGMTLPAGAQVMPDGTVMLPANGATAASACPTGYHGPLLVPATGAITSYQYSPLYGLIAVPSTQYTAGTTLIYC